MPATCARALARTGRCTAASIRPLEHRLQSDSASRRLGSVGSSLLRTLIVDDEPVARQVLAAELAEYADVEVVGEAENGDVALDRIEALEPDLVLLDIQMPSKDGFAVVRAIRGALPSIVFVTAYSDHALRAFEIGAVDYLLKPINAVRLGQAIERVRALRLRPLDSAERVARTVNAAGAGSGRDKIVARRGQDYYLLDHDEIYAFEAEGELVWAVTEGVKYIATQTLQGLEERLEGTAFRRVHRSALVNTGKVRKVSTLSSQRWLLTLSNGSEYPVSKRQAPLVRDLLR